MRFLLSHITEYHYKSPVADSVMEMRICPEDHPSQNILRRTCVVDPDIPVYSFFDYFNNRVEYFSIPFPHDKLIVDNRAEVETSVTEPDPALLDVSLAETRQLLRNRHHSLYFFLRESRFVPRIEKHDFPEAPTLSPDTPVGEAGLSIMKFIYQYFRYAPGTTSISTSVFDVIRKRRGVCQDFTHLFLSIARSLGIPARYVSGYIEAASGSSGLVGSVASHAWAEILLPGNVWWGLDPTNNKPAGEQHVKVAVGRDFSDVSPLRGTFRGGGGQSMNVKVSLKRI